MYYVKLYNMFKFSMIVNHHFPRLFEFLSFSNRSNIKIWYWITFYFYISKQKWQKLKKDGNTFMSDFSTHAPVFINIFQVVN